MITLVNAVFVKRALFNGSIGFALNLHSPLNQFAFGYTTGLEYSTPMMDTYTGHIMLGFLEIRVVRVTVDYDMIEKNRDALTKLVEELERKEKDQDVV